MNNNEKLTQEVAERCAKACGWRTSKGPNPFAKKGYTIWWWEDKDHREYELSLDPYFWFPRLWDRLVELTPTWLDIGVTKTGMDIHIGRTEPYGKPDISENNYCLALCATIEALEKK